MKTKFILCVSAVALALQGVAFAAVPTAISSAKTAVEPNSFCPEISQAQKNMATQKWRAQTQDGTWKSYQTSFATTLVQFLGAQWAGVGVGQVTCVYKAEQRFTMQGNLTIQPALPVLLVFHTLIFQPTEGKWKSEAGGVYNCYANDKEQCPFKVNIQKKSQNIFQEAETLKTSDSSALQPESY